MDWTGFALAALVSALLLLVPGWVLGRLLGLRGVLAWSVAPAVSAGTLVLASVVLGALGLRWSLLGFAVVMVLCWGLALLLSRWLPSPRRRPWSRPAAAAALGGLVVGGVLIAAELIISFGAPGNISQHFDVVFHLNAVRFILDTGNASPFVLGTLNGGSGSQSFYPAAWHGFVALTAGSTQVPVPVAANAASLVMAALVWPLGCLGLTRVVAGPGPAVLALAGVLSAGFGEFPMLLLDWGVLYADFFAVALLPAVVALVFSVAGVRGTLRQPRPLLLIPLAPALLGLMGAHPSALAALVLCTVPVIVIAQWRWFVRSTAPGRGPRLAAGLSLTVGSVLALWVLLRPLNGFPGWDPTMSSGRALLGMGATSLTSGTPSWFVAPLVLIGWGVVFGTRRIWLGIAYGVLLVFFFVAASIPRSGLRTALIDAWYQDVYRVAAIVIVLAVPLGAIGAEWLIRVVGMALSRWSPRLPLGSSGHRRAVAVCTVMLLGVVAIPGAQIHRQVEKTQAGYRFDAQSALLTPAKAQFLAGPVSSLPRGAVIADNPWDGSAFAYALADRRVLTAHLIEIPNTDQRIVDSGLRNVRHDPRVCDAVHRLGVGYALVLGSYLDNGPQARSYPGLDDLDASDGVRLISADGPARLYRVLPCEGGVTAH